MVTTDELQANSDAVLQTAMQRLSSASVRRRRNVPYTRGATHRLDASANKRKPAVFSAAPRRSRRVTARPAAVVEISLIRTLEAFNSAKFAAFVSCDAAREAAVMEQKEVCHRLEQRSARRAQIATGAEAGQQARPST